MKPNVLKRNSSGSKSRNFYFDNSALNLNIDNELKIDYRKIGVMNSNRGFFTANIVNNKIYTIGGLVSSTALKAVEEYDPNTGITVNKQPLPYAKYSHGSAVVNNKIYLIGGAYNSSTVISVVEEYDPLMNIWTTKQQLNNNRGSCTSIAYNNKVYVFGGAAGNTYFSTIDVYDPSTNTWVFARNNMSVQRSSVNLAIMNNKIYIMGGNVYGGATELIEEYDPNSNTIVFKMNMPYKKVAATAVTYKNKIYIIGNTGPYFDIITEYDPVANKVVIRNILNSTKTFYGSSSVNYNNRIYNFGGIENETYYDINEILMKEKADIILDYLETGDQIYSYQDCKVGTRLISSYELTTITEPGYLYYTGSSTELSGYILPKA